jgi:hypothetical protein
LVRRNCCSWAMFLSLPPTPWWVRGCCCTIGLETSWSTESPNGSREGSELRYSRGEPANPSIDLAKLLDWVGYILTGCYVEYMHRALVYKPKNSLTDEEHGSIQACSIAVQMID